MLTSPKVHVIFIWEQFHKKCSIIHEICNFCSEIWVDIVSVNTVTLRPRQNGRHFADGIFKCIFLNENIWIPIKISLKFVPKGPINNNPSLVQIMVWRRLGAKPLSEPMMGSLLTHICVTLPQWVNNGLLADSTKPLPEPILTYHQTIKVQWHSAISWGIPQSSIIKINSIITVLKFHSNLLGAKELMYVSNDQCSIRKLSSVLGYMWPANGRCGYIGWAHT